MRKPTDREFQDYDGMHCRSLWQSLPEDWRCPVCNRNKRGILQWGVRKGSNASKYGSIGWKAAVHLHHDHAPLNGNDFGGRLGRFPTTVICGACNSADARAKKMCGAPAWFSFSPGELRHFVSAIDNGPIAINIEVATAIFRGHNNSKS